LADAELEQIVTHCLAMDEQAVIVYSAFAQGAQEQELAAFWRRMAVEEKSHVKNWQGVLAAVRGGKFPKIFDDPMTILHDLEARRRKVGDMGGQIGGRSTVSEQFCLAYRMEFYVMHPAIERLWRYYGILEGMAVPPDKGYELHIGNFIKAMRRFGVASPELELLGESVQFIWEQVRVLGRETDEDELTKVLNRRCLFNSMRALANFAQRNRFACGVLFVDLDEFKGINDRLGHQAGDLALTEAARILRESVRASDLVGRYGGDEFLIFLPQVEAGKLADLAEKVRLAVSRGSERSLPVTVSIGAAEAFFGHELETELALLIRRADEALYEAKAAGRNRVVCAEGQATP
jgi:diguanylate cyclase (GGDEF)-like protein